MNLIHMLVGVIAGVLIGRSVWAAVEQLITHHHERTTHR